MSAEPHCHAAPDPATRALPAPGRKLLIVGAIFALVWLLSWWPPLAPLHASLNEYVGVIWWAVLLGLLVGGVIDYYVPAGVIARLLGTNRRWSLLNAAIAGVVMSACSHGILAIAMQLYKKGAGVPAIVTFLLASPWANLPITILLFGFFGWYAAAFIGGALVIALSTGFVFTLLDRYGLIEGSLPASGDGPDANHRHDRGFRSAVVGVAAGTISLANMVLWWILIGVLLAALIAAYVPEHWFMQFLGPDAGGMLATLLFATILEVCSEGTSPIAFELYRQLGVLGNPFVFLMAGVATDYTEIGLLWSNIGRRTALWLPLVAVPQILLLGWLMNVYLGA